MKIAIIGKGMIGSQIEKEMKEKNIDEIITIDIDEGKNPDYTSIDEFNCVNEIADVYIICAWRRSDVINIVKKLNTENHPLVSLETACEPGTFSEMKEIIGENGDVVVFQERYMENDFYHGIFNQPRIMGGDYIAGRKFYLRYMTWDNIVVTDDPYIAELCKIAENAYRYVEIALAQELRLMVGEKFLELRRLMNTKWNINVLEARDGIGKHCLPKDIRILSSLYQSKLFSTAEESNKIYMNKIGGKDD